MRQFEYVPIVGNKQGIFLKKETFIAEGLLRNVNTNGIALLR